MRVAPLTPLTIEPAQSAYYAFTGEMPMARCARRSGLSVALMGAAIALMLLQPGDAGAATLGGPLPTPLPLFPVSNWWNLDIRSAPVDPNSAAFITYIASGPHPELHPDFGGEVEPGSDDIYGFPYIVVNGSQTKKAVQFEVWDESDGVNLDTGESFPYYPIPTEAQTQAHWIEGGPPGNVDIREDSDRHMLIVDADNRRLYELYNVWFDGTNWQAYSGASFDLNTNARRTEGWTSGDAAGLAILPGLVRYDEVYGPDEIRHALRVTVRHVNGYVYPASHNAGNTAGAPPLGARLRLKASKDISGFDPASQKIFRAMKRYGLIVADNGTDMYVSGTFNIDWDNDILNPDFGGLNVNDFEVIQLGYQAGPTIPMADATAEGREDVMLRRGTGDVRVLTSTGSALTNSLWTSGFVDYSYDVYYADVTGDGKADLISRHKGTGNVEVYRSTGTAFTYLGGSGPGGVWSYGWGTSYDLFFADATGDGKADLIGRYNVNGDIFVFRSTGTGFSSGAPTLWSYGWTAGYNLYFADVTGDGKADIISRYFGPTEGLTGNIYVGASTGTGFGSPGLWTYGYSAGYDLYFADANGDGKADLVTRYYGPTMPLTGNVYVMRSTGAAFSWNGQYDPWTYGWGSTYDLVVRDVTGDGRADMVGRHTGNGEVYVAKSTGSAFTFSGTWATGIDTTFQMR